MIRLLRSGGSLGAYFDATFKKHPFLYPCEKWDEALSLWVFCEPKAKKGAGPAIVLPKERPDIEEVAAVEAAESTESVEAEGQPEDLLAELLNESPLTVEPDEDDF